MLNDPLANALSKLLNAEKVGKKVILIKPSSKVIEKVFEIIKEHLFLGEFEKIQAVQGAEIKVNLINKIHNCGVIKPRYPVKHNGFQKIH